MKIYRYAKHIIIRIEQNWSVIARRNSVDNLHLHSAAFFSLVATRRFVTFGPPRHEFRDSFSPPSSSPPLSDGDTYRVRVGMT